MVLKCQVVKVIILVAVFVFTTVVVTQAQNNICPNNEFDFWIGKWKIQQEIRRADGSFVELKAGCVVSKELENCLITEKWKGDVEFFWEGMKGPENISAYSFRSHNYKDSTWSIYWIDTRNRNIGAPYIGKFAGSTGEFYKIENGVTTKISFYDITDKTVSWSLSVQQPDNKGWFVLWKMYFTKKDGD